jgi:hypothetical protein
MLLVAVDVVGDVVAIAVILVNASVVDIDVVLVIVATSATLRRRVPS